jgi:hypothetical protein
MRSLKLVPLVALMAALAGCEDHHGWGETYPTTPDAPPDQTSGIESVHIDADATLQAAPGAGVGVFVEYATGGHWKVFTTCDYNTPSNPGEAPCAFDVCASVLDGGAISVVQAQDLQGPNDSVDLQSDGSLHLFTQNRMASSGMTFDAPAGATIELDVYLDGAEEPHYVYWVGDGVLHQGAPSIPLDFVPNEAVSASDPGAPSK